MKKEILHEIVLAIVNYEPEKLDKLLDENLYEEYVIYNEELNHNYRGVLHINLKLPNGHTLLTLACHHAALGQIEVAKVLINWGAHKEIRNNFNQYPIDIAKKKGNNALVNVLDRWSIWNKYINERKAAKKEENKT